ncbi:two pore calcium channel protein 2 [Platysternon megacephalum]|uniref:Two pore calcium channel protein 2 n=1 Tax=Platysternon megacephalum TaxID=55544 RepID=A0A4D9EXK9_9SAUR|nr:two pore calcium channel protein 2 [Platysternon megacephalum]
MDCSCAIKGQEVKLQKLEKLLSPTDMANIATKTIDSSCGKRRISLYLNVNTPVSEKYLRLLKKCEGVQWCSNLWLCFCQVFACFWFCTYFWLLLRIVLYNYFKM